MATTTITKSFTIKQTKYLAHGTSGAITPSSFKLYFADVIPTNATYVSCSLSVTTTDSHGKFDRSYSYITDGSNPSSGSGYTYRYALSTAGLNSAINALGLWRSKGFGVYILYKNTSTYYDYSVFATVNVTITYTVEEDPEPEPSTSELHDGDAKYIREGAAENVNIAGCYNKNWYDLQHGEMYYYSETGLIPVQHDCGNSSQHFNYKVTQYPSFPLKGAAPRVVSGVVDSWEYKNGLYYITTSSTNLTLSMRISSNVTIAGNFYSAAYVDTSRVMTSFYVSHPNTVSKSTMYSSQLCASSTATWYMNINFQMPTATSHTYIFGFGFYPAIYQTLLGDAKAQTFADVLASPALKYFLQSPEDLYGVDKGYDLDNATYWQAARFTKSVANQVATLTFSASGNHYFNTVADSGNFTAGHTYLGYVDLRANQSLTGTTYSTGMLFRDGDTYNLKTVDLTKDWTRYYHIWTYTNTGTDTNYFAPFCSRNGTPGTAYTVYLKNPVCVDVTALGIEGTTDTEIYNNFIKKYGDIMPVYIDNYKA